MMQGKKYVVVGGRVRSRTDKETHFVPAMELCHLYGVDPKACILTTESDFSRDTMGMSKDLYTFLYPDPTGEYKLPEHKELPPDRTKVTGLVPNPKS